MILFMFQNTNKEFFKVLLEEIEKQKVNKELKPNSWGGAN